MDITILKKLGLGDKEIKVYLSLIEYGSASVRSLADTTGLNRGTVYDILKKLQEQGLTSFYDIKTKQHFTAEDPSRLLGLIEEKEAEIENTKNRLKEFIPELNSLAKKGGNKPTAKLYEDKIGIRHILEDVLDSLEPGDEYYVYSATVASDDVKAAYPDFTKDRIKKKIVVKAISLAKGGSVSGLDERRWLGTDEDTATYILIYGGKCAFISRDASGKPVGVLIENEMIYSTQKNIFIKLWNFLK